MHSPAYMTSIRIGRSHGPVFSARKRCLVQSLLFHLILAGAICIAVPQSAPAQSQTDEYRVKAAFLFHFAQLVDWPPGALGDDKDAFKMCTIGEDPFHGELDGVVEGKPIGSRATHVRHLTHIPDIHDCQILFIGKNEMKKLSTLLAELGNDPVMTVGETDNFVHQGGIIGFSPEENKIRFEINLIAAERAKLKISSRLLLLAKNVVRNPAEKR